jgi:hypothetical protein
MRRLSRHGLALAALGVATLTSASARAQSGVDSLSTGIYARAGFVLNTFNADSMLFLPQRGPRGSVAPEGITGKQFGFGRVTLAGFSAGIGFDARWFYVRVGADIYEFPRINTDLADSFRARFTTHAWVSAGPRIRLGPVVLSPGMRVGALLMNATEVGPSRDGREYSAVDGVYAFELGVQWRPFRWMELDANVGHDPFTQTNATTFTVGASFGWSRAAAAPVTRR